MDNIREVRAEDKEIFISMLDEFYHSEAVLHPVPYENYENVFQEVVFSKQYMDAYLFTLDNEIAGFTTLAKTFSTEVGGQVIWIEELYIKKQFQSRGLGRKIFPFIEKTYPNVKRIRLEVESDNEKAIKLYEKMGFEVLPYSQMIKDM